MDLGGIAISCLLGPAADDGIALTNEMVRDAVARNPDRLIGFVGVDPAREGKEATRTVIERAVNEWGFRGVGELGSVDLLDPRCDAVYETCIELDVPLLVHVGIPLPSRNSRMTRLSAEKVPVSLQDEGAWFLSLFVSPADARYQSRSPGLDEPE